MRSFLDNNRVYNAAMVCVIIISLVPLLSHETSRTLRMVELSTAAIFIIDYILRSALVMFQIEPKTFDSFFDAVYWATVSLTTVGYGDIYASSLAGRVITMVSAFMGIAIVALPAGIITAGYMEELNKK